MQPTHAGRHPSSLLGPVHALVEKLAANIQQQRTRQLKRMSQLHAASVARTSKQRDSEERQQRERQRQVEIEQARAQQADASHQRAARAEIRRRERLAAAQSHSETLQRQATAKVERGALRAASAADRQDEAGLERAKQADGSARRLDGVRRRASLEAADKARAVQLRREQHEQAASKALQERRAVEAARRAEEERREVARRKALLRAEQDQAERAAYYLQRQRQKDADLQQRGVELAALRALKQREHLMRAAYARHRVELATQRQEERQAQLSSRLAEKQRRVATMEEERAAMLRALEDVRRQIQKQEAQLKQALEQMESGHPASLGRLADLQQQLAGLLSQHPGMEGARRRASHLALPPPPPKARATAVEPGQAGAQEDGCKAPAGPAVVMQDAGSTDPDTPACGSRASSSSSIASPRIAAVHPLLESDGGEQDGQAGSSADTCKPNDSSRALQPSNAQACCLAMDAQRQDPQAAPLPPSQAREKLQKVLQMEMDREVARAAVLKGVQEDGDRARLLQLFKTERYNAMALMQQLQLQLQ